MCKDGHTLAYEVPEIPDPAYSQYQAAAGGDVAGAIGGGFELLLRALASMPPRSCSADIYLRFNPKGIGQDRQSRLKLYLRLWAHDVPTARNLDRLVRGGPVSRYYTFQPIEKIPNVKGLQARCEIIRREDFIKPLYSSDLNYKILAYYYVFTPFTANQENDYLMLDQVLDCIDEPVAIAIRVQPENISPQIHAHTAYLARLADINNRWDIDDEESGGINYTDSDGPQYLRSRNQLKPLSRKDPWVNDVLRGQRENHKTFLKPHLAFSIKAEARTTPVVRLVGSVMGECAFKEGSYRIIVGDKNRALSSNPAEIDQEADLVPSALSQHISSSAELGDYEQLRPLSRLSSVDELVGLFRLPIGGYFSPCCLRKSTDPLQSRSEDLILLGYDLEIGSSLIAGSGQPRGIFYEQVNTHLCVTGLPGNGKTTAIMNILIQLWTGSLCSSDTD